jgi:predicted regulator of Ras-like GTPase activity (Roadblock/LC7/MglB family)
MHATPILTINAVNQLIDTLEDFLDKSEASFAMIIDRGGAVLCEHGSTNGPTDSSILAALAAGSFAATMELALRIGEPEFSALHQEGKHSQVFMCSVDNDAILATIFSPKTTLGLVRFYSARTVRRIGAVLQETRTGQRIAPVFSPQDVRSTETVFDR